MKLRISEDLALPLDWMSQATVVYGARGSGKTTWALKLMADEPGAWKRVNKDDLRAMLDGGRWSKDNEKFVLKMRDAMILAALEAGKHVIVDDTNLHHKHAQQIGQLVKGLAEVEVMPFDVPVAECIARDLKRPRSVGEKVIRDMHRQFLAEKPLPIERVDGLQPVIICDIDGTLALAATRGPFEWAKVGEDGPNLPVIALLKALTPGRGIILTSGRKEVCRQATHDWLVRHGINYGELLMRADDDDRKDSIVKREMFDRKIRGKNNVDFVIDDRNQVVEMWRSLGLTVLQVADGDF